MMKTNFFKSISLILFLCFGLSAWGQIYNADFSEEIGIEHTSGNVPSAPYSVDGPNWTIGYNSLPSSDSSGNYFRSNGTILESADFGGEAYFETIEINISSYSDFTITASGNTTGSGFNAGSEYFQWFYIIDGGSPVNGSSINGTGSLDQVWTEIQNTGGSTLIVGFNFNMNGGSDGFEITSIEVSGTISSTDPTLSATPSTVPDFTAEVGGADDTEDITINGINLEDDITVALSDDTNFSVSANSFTQIDGTVSETLTITYSPTTVGSHTATVTLSSTNATDVVLDLNGTATLSIPTANAASEIGSDSFTANWNAVPGAESYEIDVYTMEEGGVASDLFISEYVEGSSSNKFLEIYNGTGVEINLSDYDLSLYANGATSPTNTENLGDLQTTLANGATLVLKNSSAGLGVTAYTSSVCNFSGDDAIGLYKNSTLIDTFGTIGIRTDYGTNVTLIRKSSVSSPSDTYDENNWNSFGQDDVSNLGSHTFDGGSTIVYTLQNENVGNVTSYEVTELDPEATYYYVVRAIAGGNETANSNEIEVTTTAAPSGIIWDGLAWSNTTGPTGDDDATIDGDFTIANTETLEAKNLTVTENGSVTISDGGSLTLSGKLANEATAADFVVQSGGNLIQTTYTADDNAGAITVERNSQDIVRLDYTFWSSPVKNQQLQAFSPETLPNRIYTYETNSTTEGDHNYYAVDDAEANFTQGKGYLFRAPNNWPIPAGSPEGAPYEGVFTGEPTNGNVSVSTFNGGYTSIGNPYPSNIDPDALMDANDNLSTIYFWNNPPRVETEPGSGEYTYTGTKYVTFSTAGFVPSDYNGSSISTGQGFIVYSTGNSINFDNSMRVTAQENFFKTDEIEMNRYWIRLSNDQNQTAFNELLVNYMEGATNEVDQQIDAKLFGYNGSALYNLINEEAYVIQGRALPFADTDVVPLGFKAEEAGKFIISLANFDGLFAEGETTIYLKDKALNITHNLMESDYAFESEAGEFNNRFEVVYVEGEVMNVDDLTAGNILIYKNQKAIAVKSASAEISSVEAYDLQGKLIHNQTQVNAQTYQFETMAKGVLVIRVKTADGKTTAKKIIN